MPERAHQKDAHSWVRSDPSPTDVRMPINDLERLMAEVCAAAGVPAEASSQVVWHYLTGELRGKPSHGVAKFVFESRFFPERQAPPEVVRQRGVFATIDAHPEVGPLSTDFAVSVTVERARLFGAGVVGMINTQRYGILADWSEAIARRGLIGIATNTTKKTAARKPTAKKAAPATKTSPKWSRAHWPRRHAPYTSDDAAGCYPPVHRDSCCPAQLPPERDRAGSPSARGLSISALCRL
ncbi:Ldh family oxidoreductase [Streptomyces sp. NPDC046915]|uniref:Ldh family oxidoreductase n=1 Tax=Streptomyces sp. NPDC046915 TaxID=3155257 RepID=UPI0033C7147B